MALVAYFPCLLISLGIPEFRAHADRILRKSVDLMLRTQSWLRFETADFERALAEARAVAARRGTGVLLVANHRSHLDMFLLLARVAGIRVLAKSGLFAVPFLGVIMWTSRQIPVRRRDLRAFVAAMDVIGERLAAGEVVHVFPEMTRAEPGFPGVAPFNPAPFLVAQKIGAPILPFVIRGTSAIWPKGSFAIRTGSAVVDPLAPIVEPAAFSGAKELAEECRAAIEAAYRGGRA